MPIYCKEYNDTGAEVFCTTVFQNLKLVRVREGKKPVAFRVEFCSVTGFFFPCVPWGICGKKQGFHINDDRVPLYRRKREIRDDGLCSPHLRLLTWPHDI